MPLCAAFGLSADERNALTATYACAEQGIVLVMLFVRLIHLISFQARLSVIPGAHTHTVAVQGVGLGRVFLAAHACVCSHFGQP